MREKISIPVEYVELCQNWHGGQSSMMYAVSSTGGLTRGTIRPKNDNDEPMTDDEWLCHLYETLLDEVEHIMDEIVVTTYDKTYSTIWLNFTQWIQKRIDNLIVSMLKTGEL